MTAIAMPERSLSEAEREVHRLALTGLANAAIAEIRRSSPRTVANQLAAIYRKLGVTSRRELRARALVDAGWPLPVRFQWGGGDDVLILRPHPAPQRLRALTAREQQVLEHAALGWSNKLIAYSLGLSLSAVGTHLARARRKLRKMAWLVCGQDDQGTQGP